MIDAFAAKSNLRSASRLPAFAGEARISATEVAALLACGALAALAVGLLHLSLRVPGHAILRGVLPMAMGLAVVPRRSAGIIMSIGAGLTATAMTSGEIGSFQPAALLSLLALGPVLDIALLGKPQGWRLYARFILAGAASNLLSFALKVAMLQFGWDTTGGRNFTSFWSLALPSFVFCGALAGLISAAVWFRLRVDESR